MNCLIETNSLLPGLSCKAFVAVLFLTLFGWSNVASAQQSSVPASVAGPTTTALVRIQPSFLKSLIRENVGQDGGPRETVFEQKLLQTLEILGDDPVWVTADWPRLPVNVKVFIRGSNDADASGKVEQLSKLWYLKNPPRWRSKWTISVLPLKDADTKSTDARLARWRELMDADEQKPIQMAILPPPHLYDTYRELLSELPPYLGGGPITLLTDGALSAQMNIEPDNESAAGFIQSASAEAATALAARIPKLTEIFAALTPAEENKDLLNFLNARLQELTCAAEGDRVTIRFRPTAGDQDFKQQWITLLEGTLDQSVELERLRTIALGLLNYESANRHFPTPNEARDANGQAGLSWRVYILPFIGEGELFKKFALDQPWDSPQNIKLLKDMPNIYRWRVSHLFEPADAKPGRTTVVAPVSENTILGAPRETAFGNISDGSSNTILLVSVKDKLAVPWTSPQDYRFDRENPAAGLHFHNGKTAVAISDGSTIRLDQDNDWLALFEMSDGKVVRMK